MNKLYNVQKILDDLLFALEALRKGQNPDTQDFYDIGDPERATQLNPDEYLQQAYLQDSGRSPEEVCLHLAFLYGVEQGRRVTKWSQCK